MSHPASLRFRWPVIVIIAALVVVVAGMKAASDLLEPFLLAIFFSIFCAPWVTFMTRRRIPEWLAVTLVVTALFVALLIIATALGASMNSFVRHLPDYQTVFLARLESVFNVLQGWGIELDISSIREEFDPKVLVGILGKTATQLGSALGTLMLVLLTVAFILLEAARFPAKLHAALGEADQGLAAFDRFSTGVKDYLAIKSMLSLGTGVAVFIWLWLCDVEYPLLWGMMAFFFNYIPNIGPFIAAIPACLLALVLNGFGNFAVVIAGYSIINMITGNVIEPKMLGKTMGLSTLVVFCSLIFWGWILGPIGMVLSVPLTMILRIGLDSSEETRWAAVLLGPEVENKPPVAVSPKEDQPTSGA